MTITKNSRFYLLCGVLLATLLVAAHHAIFDKINSLQESAVLDASEAANADLTRLFVNEVFGSLDQPLALTSDSNNQPSVLNEADFADFNQRARKFMLGTNFLKLKIYNLNGITIFSSDPKQLGSDYSDNIGFTSSLNGNNFSESQLRTEFSGYNGSVYNRDIVSSYVPIRSPSSSSSGSFGRVIGVAEVYSDRTDVLNNARDALRDFKFIFALVLMLVGLIVAATIWYASISLTERYIRAAEQDQ